jgi:N utilization substance protein B
MISRRLLRIKVLQTYYAHRFAHDKLDITAALKTLSLSIQRFHHQYILLIDLLAQIYRLAEQRLEIEQAKFFKSKEAQLPFLTITNNTVLKKVFHSYNLEKYTSQYHISWKEEENFLRFFFHTILKSDFFKKHIENESSFENDQELCIAIYDLLSNDDNFYSELEAKSIFWNDDYFNSFPLAIKTIKKINQDNDLDLFPLYNNEEDFLFGKKLLEHTIIEQDERQKLLLPFLKRWDLDRLYSIDLFIMELAITEFLHFPTIPIKVSINEYIEISKYYGTKKSWAFINGILDKIKVKLLEENHIKKTGRGLIDS